MMTQLWNDEAGFVISAELVLVATILVIGLIVGLAEVQAAVVQELNDVGDAIGKLNQSYFYTGWHANKTQGIGLKSFTVGSQYTDRMDECDMNDCQLSCDPPVPEAPKL
jgi:hypothetical protein